MKAAVIIAALVLATPAWTQLSTPAAKRQVATLQSSKSAAKQFSPEEKLWCPLLRSVLSRSAAAEPPMRSYLLDTIAGGLSKCDPRKVRIALVDSFTASLAMPENQEEISQRTHRFVSEGQQVDQAFVESIFNLETKQRLQESALTHLLPVEEAKVESLLPQAEPDVGATLLGWMVAHATSAKKFNRALALLQRVPPKERFPYEEATELMLVLPPERDADKQEIFQLAMVADREQHSVGMVSNDFASMIVRFWRHLPPALALDAIHQVLDAAHTRVGAGVTLNAASGKVRFPSEYEYRVFELLPVLRQLDDDEADKLLTSSQQAQFQLKQFPNGVQSIDPTIRDTPPKEGEREQVGGSMGFPDRTDQALQAMNTRVQEIGRMAEDNPRQAIAAAATLPESVGPFWHAEPPAPKPISQSPAWP